MIFKTIAIPAIAAGFVFALASCASTQKDPYDTSDLYGYPDADNPDGSLYDVPPDFEDGNIDAGGSSTTYTVVAGDTLSKISKKFNVRMQSIISANGISNPNMLSIGQQLTIPSR